METKETKNKNSIEYILGHLDGEKKGILLGVLISIGICIVVFIINRL